MDSRFNVLLWQVGVVSRRWVWVESMGIRVAYKNISKGGNIVKYII